MMMRSSKILSIIVICVVIIFALLIGFFFIIQNNNDEMEMKMKRNRDDNSDVNDTTEMIINSTEIEDFGGPKPAIVIAAPPKCKNGEKLEVKTNTCRKIY